MSVRLLYSIAWVSMDLEVVAGKNGRITIPAKVRRKFKLKEGTRLKVTETSEGILFKPKKRACTG
jgi:AbrB family looped-hinge helix DNA binding protein